MYLCLHWKGGNLSVISLPKSLNMQQVNKMPLLNSLFKGYQITFTKRNILRLHMTDGFNTDGFQFDVDLFPTEEVKDRYEIMKKGNQMSLVSFVLDVVPKLQVVSLTIICTMHLPAVGSFCPENSVRSEGPTWKQSTGNALAVLLLLNEHCSLLNV